MEEICVDNVYAGSSPTTQMRRVRCSDGGDNKAHSRRKYIFNDQIDQLIREIYLCPWQAKTRPGIRLLAKKIGIPHWAPKERARELSLARTKELPWSEPELAILAGMRG